MPNEKPNVLPGGIAPNWTEEECATFLRCSRSSLKIYRERKKDPIPFAFAGRRYLYAPEAVMEWLSRQEPTPAGRHPKPGNGRKRKPSETPASIVGGES